MNTIDLHCHSTCSDGHYNVPDLISLARERGVKVLSLTDHNTVSGVPQAIQEGKKNHVRIITGIELATDFEEILGYFIDIEHPEILDLVKRHQKRAFLKIDLTVGRFAELGYPVCTEEVMALANKMGVEIPMRFHILEILKAKGKVKSIRDGLDMIYRSNLFEDVLSVHIPGMPSIQETIKAIIHAGGVPVMAHPGYCRQFLNYQKDPITAKNPRYIKDRFKHFASWGLAGAEGNYPINSSDEYPNREKHKRTINRVVSSLGLLLTGGSDFHGEDVVPDNVLGKFGISEETLEKLEALRPLQTLSCQG